MNYIFLGLMFTNQSLSDAKKNARHSLSMAAHIFQTTLVDGLTQAGAENLITLSVPPVGSFPINYKTPFIRAEEQGNHIQIGYLNFPWVKRIQQQWALKRRLIDILSQQSDNTCILAYGTYLPFLRVLNHIKKRFSGVKTGMIVTDCIPGRGDMDEFMTAAAKRRGDQVIKLAKQMDGFVLLTKALVEALEIDDKPFVVTECICNETQQASTINQISHNRCLYTGTLRAEYGICEMIEAFTHMNNAELWICGGGCDRSYVEQMAAKYDNIKYLGFLNQEDLQNVRNHCDFLINPRRPSGTYTRYSFPSKTAEYMASGKPVIMYKLEGLPDEYDEYLNYLSADKPEGIREELNKLFAIDYASLTGKAAAGRDFMLTSKNARAQAQKIISMYGSSHENYQD